MPQTLATIIIERDADAGLTKFVNHDLRSPVLTDAGATVTFRGTDVVAILERACKEVGFPATIRGVNIADDDVIAVGARGTKGPLSSSLLRSYESEGL
ncbi:hypothetical protein [Bradyrhizobium sp. Arg816]|uniref:hypothetical protein n=1 Tax=Bradyrhizobium sp. Arg816 TaxID=2998491 RepID=UPI00249E710D|nr:hypothetical protein [Bradyrhizobium sp. Arg816]MDI3567507.1 hypothetical protein [Bradyrhizobium sp. Arg816]